MIEDATVAYLSASDWSAPWHLPQEVAAGLGRAGARVIYVESLGWRRPRPFDVPRIAGRLARAARARARPRDAHVAPNVELLSPLLIPGARSAPAAALNRSILSRQLARRIARRPGPLVVWAFTPSRLAVDAVEALRPDLALYYCIQSHVHRPLAPPDTAALERALIERVDAVVTDAILLHRERVGLHPYVYRVPGGVDLAAHAGAEAPPDWLSGLPRPVVGYLGTIDHRIDVGLIAALARAHPRWSVAVVGPVVDASVAPLAGIPNVILHGHVPIGDVPAVMAGFDVGLMAYADQPMTPYTYPAKLHQYLAAGLPIASTPLPDLADFGSLVEVGAGPAGLAAAVERALAAPPRADERRAVAARHTWTERMRALTAIVEGHLRGDPPPSSDDFRP